jgi:hypothetical protein
MRITLKNVKLAFPQLQVPTQVNDIGDFKFRTRILLEKGSVNEKLVQTTAAQEAKKVFGVDEVKIVRDLKTRDNYILHDGDNKPDLVGFPGMTYISCSNKDQPTLYRKDGSKIEPSYKDGKEWIVPGKSREFTSGNIASVILDVYAMKGKITGIFASIIGIKFEAVGDGFTQDPVTIDEFGTSIESSDADDFI